MYVCIIMYIVSYTFSKTYAVESCDSEEFICDNGECVPDELRCDNADDCGDNSDEDGCGMSCTLSICE